MLRVYNQYLALLLMNHLSLRNYVSSVAPVAKRWFEPDKPRSGERS
jgi:hypothetical protein